MKIEGDLTKTLNFKKIRDIDSGECFQFLDNETLFMRAEDIYIKVCDGTVHDDIYTNNRPVREIQTKIVVEN